MREKALASANNSLRLKDSLKKAVIYFDTFFILTQTGGNECFIVTFDILWALTHYRKLWWSIWRTENVQGAFEGVGRAGSVWILAGIQKAKPVWLLFFLSLLKHKRGDSKEINLFYTMKGDHTFKVQKRCTRIKEAVQKVFYMTHALYSKLPSQIKI